jgi:hypothetical protein
MMQSQIHLKKAGQTAKSRELASKNRSAVLAPVMELNKKQKKDDKSDDFKARQCLPGSRLLNPVLRIRILDPVPF